MVSTGYAHTHTESQSCIGPQSQLEISESVPEPLLADEMERKQQDITSIVLQNMYIAQK